MRSRTARAALVALPVALAAAATACSLTTSLSGFSDGSDGEGDGATAADAQSSETGNTGSEAGPDGRAPDGSVDGSADARTGFRCTDRPLVFFCSDFETDPYYFGWNENNLALGGVLAFTQASTSRGVKATLPDHSNKPYAYLVRELLLPAGAPFTYSFDMFAPANSTGGVVDLSGFIFRGALYQALLRSYQGGEYYVQEYADAKGGLPQLSRGSKLSRGPLPNTWTHVEMRVSFTANSSAIRIKLDNDVVLDGTLEAWNYVTTPTHIALGIPSTDSAGTTFSASFDDVIVTTP